MKQIYHRYEHWEDYSNGMFTPTVTDGEIAAAAALLKNQSALWEAMYFVAGNWKHAAEVNLSNRSRNRQAWLGQAACSYACKASEDATKQAWRTLSDVERSAANWTADRVIADWEAKFRSCQSANLVLTF